MAECQGPIAVEEAGSPGTAWGLPHRRRAPRAGLIQPARCAATADCVGTSISGPFSEKETAIIFDFDDTLFPSSFVDRRKLIHTKSLEELPADLKRGFAELEKIVSSLLTAALEFGTVLIITNAQTGWVELCVSKFMPSILGLLAEGSVRVVSARSNFERYFPADPLCWKAAAFAHELHQLQKLQGNALRNIMSFGDSMEERMAVKIAAGQLHSLHKSVKFLDAPTPRQLHRQLEVVTNCLEWIWRHKGDLDVVLTLEQAAPASNPQEAPEPEPPRTPTRDM